MQADEKPKFSDLFDALVAVFPARNANPVTVEVYWRTLEDLPFPMVSAAVTRALRECEFMPVPATLRRLAGCGTDEDALLAWTSVVETIRRYGSWVCPHFADPATGQAINDLGGWVYLCGLSSDELHKFARRDFLKSHAILSQRPGLPDPGPLKGLNTDGASVPIPLPDGLLRLGSGEGAA